MSSSEADSMREQLLEIIAKEGMIAREKLVPEATMESLGMASYDMVMVLMGIEDNFGVYITVDTDLSEVKTLEALLDHLAARIASGESDPKPDPNVPPSGLKAE